MKRAVIVAALAIAAPRAVHADELEPRVMVIPVAGTAPVGLGELITDVENALATGAGRMTSNVSRATASLTETAVIVGCEPTEASCLDDVAAALNVDQLLIADVAAKGGDATIDVTAVTRDSEPVRQQFTVHAKSRDDDLRILEEAVPVMLEAGEARKGEGKEPPPPPPPPPDGGKVVVTTPPQVSSTPLVVAGAGGALLIAGGIFWALAGTAQDEIDSAPTGSEAELEHLADLEASARRNALAGNVLTVGGGAIVIGGLVWYYLEWRGAHSEVHVEAAPTAGGATVGIGGVW
jgi:hypothetical protein